MMLCKLLANERLTLAQLRNTVEQVFEMIYFDGNNLPPSFLSNRTVMTYTIETANGHYFPAGFNIGSELEVKYEHRKCITITMMKCINYYSRK